MTLLMGLHWTAGGPQKIQSLHGERRRTWWSTVNEDTSSGLGKTVKIENGTTLNLKPWCEPSLVQTVVSSSTPNSRNPAGPMLATSARSTPPTETASSLFALWHREQQHATPCRRGLGQTAHSGGRTSHPNQHRQPSRHRLVGAEGSQGRRTFHRHLRQAHDPKSVVEYKFIKARHLDPKDMTRAERLDVRLSSEDVPEKEWWNRMDHGPFVLARPATPWTTQPPTKA